MTSGGYCRDKVTTTVLKCFTVGNLTSIVVVLVVDDDNDDTER
jgi:hypothetical protein